MRSMSKSSGSSLAAAASISTRTRCRLLSTCAPGSTPMITTSCCASASLPTGIENSSSSKSSANGTAILLMTPPRRRGPPSCGCAAWVDASATCGLRDLADRLAALARIHDGRQVGHGYGADQAVILVEHRQSPDLLALHDLSRSLHLVVGQTVVDARSHHLRDSLKDWFASAAVARTVMSRSVTMPTRRSPSQTGIDPTSRSRMRSAACCTVASGSMVSTGFMISAIRMASPPAACEATRVPSPPGTAERTIGPLHASKVLHADATVECEDCVLSRT